MTIPPRALVRLQGLERALGHGGDTHDVEHVIDLVRRGQATLWEVEDAVIVTEIHRAPNRTSLHFWLATGKLDAVIALSHEILRIAKVHGIRYATLAGRKGWLRVAAAEGWRPSKVVLMEREI